MKSTDFFFEKFCIKLVSGRGSLVVIIPAQNVDVEEFKDAPVHKLPDAGHNPGRPPVGRQVYGLRPPHESRPRRLRGVPQASSCQRKERTNNNEEREDRCTLGLVLLRGEEVISMTVEGPAPPEESRAKAVNAAAMAGPGIGRAAGRGIPTAPLIQAQPGLSGPVRGVGGPALGMMQPQMARPQLSAPPMTYPTPPVMRPPPYHPGQGPPPNMECLKQLKSPCQWEAKGMRMKMVVTLDNLDGLKRSEDGGDDVSLASLGVFDTLGKCTMTLIKKGKCTMMMTVIKIMKWKKWNGGLEQLSYGQWG
uniref:Uncharacterized protein n=1 Tax=Fagus sylvatica TaxID=28930 RepID=A0A2N9EY00_FAGSY